MSSTQEEEQQLQHQQYHQQLSNNNNNNNNNNNHNNHNNPSPKLVVRRTLSRSYTGNASKCPCKTVTVSAPGKLLLAGGYLVLEEEDDNKVDKNVGLILAVDKRLYTTCQVYYSDTNSNNNNDNEENDDDSDDDDDDSSDDDDGNKFKQSKNMVIPIKVESPQLDRSIWYYEYDIDNHTLLMARNNTHTSCNPFIEKTIRLSLLYLLPISTTTSNNNSFSSSSSSLNNKNKKIRSIHLIIRGDNEFYSLLPHVLEQQRNNNNINNNNNNKYTTTNTNTINTTTTTLSLYDAAEKLPKFLRAVQNKVTGKYYKTGLGSSACLVTSIVASLTYSILYVLSGRTIPMPKNQQQQQQQKVQVQVGQEVENDAKDNNINKIIYNLSQLCHCYAQGKIGSGFDVSAACYGSQVYNRFSESIITELLNYLSLPTTTTSVNNIQQQPTEQQEQQQHQQNSNNNNNSNHDDNNATSNNTSFSTQEEEYVLLSLLQKTVESEKWNNKVQAPIYCTRILQIIMADVSSYCGFGGSESPGMAKKVLEWKRNQQQQQKQTKNKDTATTADNSNHILHWDDLKRLNQHIVMLIQQITIECTRLSDNELNTIKDMLITTKAKQWQHLGLISSSTSSSDTSTDDFKEEKNISTSVNTGLPSLLYQLHVSFQETRYHLKHMGEIVGVPIEPDSQTVLADGTIANVPGVVAAVVPGAGGYDALAVLYINDDTVRYNIASYWSSVSSSSSSLSSTTDNMNNTICALPCRAVDYGHGIRIEPNEEFLKSD